MHSGGLAAAIVQRYPHQNIFRIRLRIFDKYVVITVLVEYARIEQFEFWLISATSRVFFAKLLVGELLLGIFVEHLKIRMRRRGIEVIIDLLHVLSVVSFGVGQPEQTLF